MWHALTIELPEDYRARGLELVGLSFFQGQGSLALTWKNQSSRWAVKSIQGVKSWRTFSAESSPSSGSLVTNLILAPRPLPTTAPKNGRNMKKTVLTHGMALIRPSAA